MIRRVLNLVVKNTSTGVHSVRRIDPYKHLFYGSADEAAAANANANKGMVDRAAGMQTLVLPDPAVSFAPSPTAPLPHMAVLDLFALLGTGGSEGRIVSANVAGEAVLYDADERLFLNLPWLNEPKGFLPVCISVALPGAPENSLYAMERCTGATMQDNASSCFDEDRDDTSTSCFEVLEYGPRHGGEEVRDMHRGWRWRTLPPPPFIFRPAASLHLPARLRALLLRRRLPRDHRQRQRLPRHLRVMGSQLGQEHRHLLLRHVEARGAMAARRGVDDAPPRRSPLRPRVRPVVRLLRTQP